VFNRFSKSTREVVTSAVREARGRGARRIGTDHLLLGLLHDPGSAAARALGVSLDAAREALQSLDVEALAAVGVAVDPVELSAGPVRPSGHLPFTAAARSALQRTLREAGHMNSPRLEPTHVLLAVLDAEAPDRAADVLARLTVDPSVVRARLATAS
jgi:ATP-dependent Clp protease ATP-binding subunit ClpA